MKNLLMEMKINLIEFLLILIKNSEESFLEEFQAKRP